RNAPGQQLTSPAATLDSATPADNLRVSRASATFLPTGKKANPALTHTFQLAGGEPMFLTLFIILLLAWIFGFTLFHVTSFLIHILLIAAVIALILHFVRPRSTVA